MAVGGVGAAVGVVQAAADADAAGERVPRERAFSEVSGCLLTDADGVSGSPADQVWAGLQEASALTSAKATFTPVLGRASLAQVVPLVNALVLSQCDLVIGVGEAQALAVESVAAAHPGIRFAVLGDAPANDAVQVLPSEAAAARTAVVEALAAVAGGER